MRTLVLVNYLTLPELVANLEVVKGFEQPGDEVRVLVPFHRFRFMLPQGSDAMLIKEYGYRSILLTECDVGLDKVYNVWSALSGANIFQITECPLWIGDIYDGHYSSVAKEYSYYFEGLLMKGADGYGRKILLAALVVQAKKDGFEKVLYVTKAPGPHPPAGKSQCEIWLDLMQLVKVAFPCPYLQVLVWYKNQSGCRILSQV